MNTVRVFVADDHRVVIKGICECFEEIQAEGSKNSSIKVVGHATTSNELLDNANREDVDVFVTDLGFESTQGDVTIIEDIIKRRADARIVVFSLRRSVHTITACYRYGAKAYVTKSDDPDQLIQAVFAAAENRDYYVPRILQQIGMMSLRNPFGYLGEREKRLFILLAQNTDISIVERELGISEKTINNLVTNKIKPVLGVTRKDFRSFAIAKGLIDDLGP